MIIFANKKRLSIVTDILATIDKSITKKHLKRKILLWHKQNRLFSIAVVTEPAKADSVTGNFETTGSKFSNETRFREAACVLAIVRKVYKKLFSLGPSPLLS